MAEIYPFRALQYNQEKITDLATVVTQPYDKITPEMQERYYNASPYNFIRIIKGKASPEDTATNNVYTRAAAFFKQWQAEGALKPIDHPALFAYFQEYTIPGTNERRMRKGFIGLGKIEEYSAGVIFPHERTLTSPKIDRLELLRATQAHLEQLFMIYSDPEGKIDQLLDQVAQHRASLQVRDDYDVLNYLWPITDESLIAKIQNEMKSKKLIIADGHHRYETVLNYRNERRAKAGAGNLGEMPYDRAMMTFINMDNEGLTLLPTHRLVSNLEHFNLDRLLTSARSYFDIREYSFSGQDKAAVVERFRKGLKDQGVDKPCIGLYSSSSSSFYLLALREGPEFAGAVEDVSPIQRKLDVVVLHHLLISKCLGITAEDVAKERHIKYLREFEAGIEAVDSSAAQLCFFLNPTRIEQVRTIALAGETLPQKSTDFYPKLLSGLTIYDMGA